MAKTLGVAVSGCGKAGLAQLHWFARHPNCKIVALYDPDESKANACAKKYGAPTLPSYEALANHAQVDLISLCGPESARCQQALSALENGTHVLCEKPFANSLDECDAMIAAAARHQLSLLAFFNMRFHPVVQAVEDRVAEIGSIYAARFSYTQFPHGGQLASQAGAGRRRLEIPRRPRHRSGAQLAGTGEICRRRNGHYSSGARS